ncbi:MAG TPA: protein kinase [Pirellulaceae bacterium]|jgi:tRNA A-37 threonylcarbamoyl transferase component Bud32|nr:protein kinase [Pirellulaceae bacterium]
MSRSEDRQADPTANPPGELSEVDEFEIERACDRFEAAWRADQPLSIERVLHEVPERLRPAALRELVAIEIERRGDQGERVSGAEYRDRFPELTKFAAQPTAADQVASAASMSPASAAEPQNKAFDAEPQPGDDVGDYRLLEKLGAGGMGTVYKAVHRHMGRVVAMKALQSRWLAQRDLAKRFEREVRAAARLHHPNVVVAFDAREENGRRWLVTEYLEGIDLSKLVRRDGPLPIDTALGCLLQAARGLEYAHARGLVHRDVKPGNLFLTIEGTVKVLDLGLSRFVALDDEDWVEPLTSSGAFLGTASFVAPEQARNSRRADGRADIYSLGCTLHYLLTGKPPFRGETTIDVLIAHATEPPPTLPDFGLSPQLADRLRSIFGRMTARRLDDRFATMSEVVAAVEDFLGSTAGSATPAAVPRGDAVPSRTGAAKALPRDALQPIRTGAWIAAALALALVAGAIAWGVYSQSGRLVDDRTRPVRADVTAPVRADVTTALAFDGEASYVEISGFEPTPDQPATIEAVARPDRAKNGNLISWMGPDWMALYLSSDGRWGIAKQIGATSHLFQADDPAPLDRFGHVSGSWDGERLRLYVDGEEVPATRTEFVLPRTSPGLFIGGVAEGRVPEDQADRYFAGEVRAVRISRGARLPSPDDADHASWTVGDATLALFRFGEGAGTETIDEAAGRVGTLHGARWVELP